MVQKIVAVAYHTGGAKAIAPVVQELKRDSGLEVIVVAENPGVREFKDRCIEYKTPADYSATTEKPPSFMQIIEKEKPDFVLTGTSAEYSPEVWTPERAITRCAQERDITTLAVLDYWAEYGMRFRGCLPDKIAVMDELAMAEMIDEGFSRDILVVTGNPSFDQLGELRENYSPEDGLKVRRDLGIAEHCYLMLYASQPIEATTGADRSNPAYLGYTEKTVLRDILDALKEIPTHSKGRTLLLKIHPRAEKPEGVKAVADEYREAYTINRDYNIFRAVLASDIVLSPHSTTVLETLLLDRPALSIQPGLLSYHPNPAVTEKMGVTPKIHKEEEVKLILEKAMFDEHFQLEMVEKRREIMQHFGDATGRVIALVYAMMGLKYEY